MKAVLKSFDCADHDPIDSWCPDKSESVDYWLCLHIGPAGREGADLFYVNVLSKSTADAISSGKRIVVCDYSWTEVRDRVEAILRSADSENWNSIVKKLCESFEWEFEGYKDTIQ